jgi:DNA-binding transcriptional ArsR family regulator
VIDQNFVRAVAHPLRVEILEMLGYGVASPNTLAENLGVRLSDVAYHVRVLASCGALDLIAEEQRRGATEHFYRAKPEAFMGGREWRKVPRSLRGGGVSASSLRVFFDRAIKALKAGTLDARDDAALSCMGLAVDEQGWEELVEVKDKLLDSALAIHERSAKRLAGSGGISVVLGLAAFEAAQPKRRRGGSRHKEK